MEITTVGLDLAKSVFQVHGINGVGEVVVRKTIRRAQVLKFFERLDPCLVGIEACGTSHYWAREISKLGHRVRLMPPAYVKPYVKRGKTDASDAEAICEAVSRPTMRYVAIKSCEQQAALTVHRTRDLFVKQRTQLVNMIRGLLAEFGIEIRRGITHAMSLAERIAAGKMPDVPALAAKMITSLAGQILDLEARLREIERELLAWHRSSDIARRLATIQGWAPFVPRRSPLPSPIRSSSVPGDSSPRGWASRRCSIRAAARNGLEEYRRWATNICAVFSSSG